MVPNQIKEAAEALLVQNEQGVYSFKTNGDVYWLKIAGEEKSNFVRKLSSSFHACFKINYLRTNASGMSPWERLQHEKQVIHHLGAKGTSVPLMVCEGNNYFVTQDAGVPLHAAPQEILTSEFLQRLFVGLMQLHQLRVAHGRPSVRDLVVNEKKDITFVDFEESQINPGPAMKARDFMLMILDLERLNLSGEKISDAITHWLEYEEKEVFREFRKLVLLLKIIRHPAKLILIFKPRNRLSRQIIQSASILEAVLKKNAL
ncbi:MAG: hypothetical protein GWO81_02615 [Verrucomicrobia bacterium]|nr:hypothetical protein [Verrucomicrobiota bacterium]